MNFFQKYKADIAALGIFAIGIFWAFRRIILNPNAYLFGDSGDGIKNYFTFVYYLKYDRGLHFSGMNYPYGEHISFTDNQPTLALLFKFINDHIFELSNYGVAILNLSLVVSVFVGAFFCYKILKDFGSQFWIAVAGALIIVFLSPQFGRFHAHYALAHIAFIPMNIWLIFKLNNANKPWVFGIILAIVVILQAFVHFYFLPITLAFGLLFAALYAYFQRKEKGAFKKSGILIASIIIAAALTLIISKATDPVTDRQDTPYGINAYTSTFESVFSPNVGPLQKIIRSGNQRVEGIGYVGILGLLFIPLVLIHLFLLKRKKRLLFTREIKNYNLLLPAFIASIIVYLFSTGMLYRMGLSILLEIIPPLKQFRSLGRFVWVFYYCFLFFMIVQLAYLFKNEKLFGLKYLPKIIAILGLLIFAVEANWNYHAHVDKIYRINNSFPANRAPLLKKLQENGYEPADFQAIVSLPLFVVGANSIQIETGVWPAREAFALSYQTGLPLMDIMMSRTSESQSLELVEFVSSIGSKKRMAHMDDRSILVICKEKAMNKIEHEFLKKSKLLFEFEERTFYEIQAKDLISTPVIDEALISKTDSLIQSGQVILKSWNSEQHISYAGTNGRAVGQDVIWSGNAPDSQRYEVSFWLNLYESEVGRSTITFQKVIQDGRIVYQDNFKYFETPEVHNGWMRVDWEFDGAPTDTFKILIHGNNKYIDELLIKPKGQDVMTHSGTDLLYNNYLIEEKN